MDDMTHATRFMGWKFCCPKCHEEHTIMASIENFPGARVSLQCKPDTCGHFFTAILGDELGHPLSQVDVEQSCRVMDEAKRKMPSDILWDEKGCVKGMKTDPVVERKETNTLKERFNSREVLMETHRIVSFLRKEQGKDGQEWFHRKVLEIWTNPPYVSPLELDAALKQLIASNTIETKKFPENGDSGGDLVDFYRLAKSALRSQK